MADRAAFEAWALRELKQDAANWVHPNGEYVYLQSEWKAWQEAVLQERERCAKAFAYSLQPTSAVYLPTKEDR